MGAWDLMMTCSWIALERSATVQKRSDPMGSRKSGDDFLFDLPLKSFKAAPPVEMAKDLRNVALCSVRFRASLRSIDLHTHDLSMYGTRLFFLSGQPLPGFSHLFGGFPVQLV